MLSSKYFLYFLFLYYLFIFVWNSVYFLYFDRFCPFGRGVGTGWSCRQGAVYRLRKSRRGHLPPRGFVVLWFWFCRLPTATGYCQEDRKPGSQDTRNNYPFFFLSHRGSCISWWWCGRKLFLINQFFVCIIYYMYLCALLLSFS